MSTFSEPFASPEEDPPPWSLVEHGGIFKVSFCLGPFRDRVGEATLLISFVGDEGDTQWLDLGAIEPSSKREITLEVDSPVGNLQRVILGHTNADGLGVVVEKLSVLDDENGMLYEFETDFLLQANDEEFASGVPPSVALEKKSASRQHAKRHISQIASLKLRCGNVEELERKLEGLVSWSNQKDMQIVHVSRNPAGNRADVYVRPLKVMMLRHKGMRPVEERADRVVWAPKAEMEEARAANVISTVMPPPRFTQPIIAPPKVPVPPPVLVEAEERAAVQQQQWGFQFQSSDRPASSAGEWKPMTADSRPIRLRTAGSSMNLTTSASTRQRIEKTVSLAKQREFKHIQVRTSSSVSSPFSPSRQRRRLTMSSPKKVAILDLEEEEKEQGNVNATDETADAAAENKQEEKKHSTVPASFWPRDGLGMPIVRSENPPPGAPSSLPAGPTMAFTKPVQRKFAAGIARVPQLMGAPKVRPPSSSIRRSFPATPVLQPPMGGEAIAQRPLTSSSRPISRLTAAAYNNNNNNNTSNAGNNTNFLSLNPDGEGEGQSLGNTLDVLQVERDGEEGEDTEEALRDPPPLWEDPVLFSKYNVHVRMGPVRNHTEAGTLIITLVGEETDSGWIELNQVRASTQRKQLVETAEHLGNLQHVIIGHNNLAGLGIFIEEVQVMDEATGLLYTFGAGKWIQSEKEGEAPAEMFFPVEQERIYSAAKPSKIVKVKLRARTQRELATKRTEFFQWAATQGMTLLHESVNSSGNCADLYVFVDASFVREQLIRASAVGLLWSTMLRTRARRAYIIVYAFETLVQIVRRNRIRARFQQFLRLSDDVLKRMLMRYWRWRYVTAARAGHIISAMLETRLRRRAHLLRKRCASILTARVRRLWARKDFIQAGYAVSVLKKYVIQHACQQRHRIRLQLSFHACILQRRARCLLASRRWQVFVTDVRARIEAAFTICDRAKAGVHRSFFQNSKLSALCFSASSRRVRCRRWYSNRISAAILLSSTVTRMLVQRRKHFAASTITAAIRSLLFQADYAWQRLAAFDIQAALRQAMYNRRYAILLRSRDRSAARLQSCLRRNRQMICYSEVLNLLFLKERQVRLIWSHVTTAIMFQNLRHSIKAVQRLQAYVRKMVVTTEVSRRVNAIQLLECCIHRVIPRLALVKMWNCRNLMWGILRRWATRRKLPRRVALAIGSAWKRPHSNLEVSFQQLEEGILIVNVTAATASRCRHKMTVLEERLVRSGLKFTKRGVEGDETIKYSGQFRVAWNGPANTPPSSLLTPRVEEMGLGINNFPVASNSNIDTGGTGLRIDPSNFSATDIEIVQSPVLVDNLEQIQQQFENHRHQGLLQQSPREKAQNNNHHDHLSPPPPPPPPVETHRALKEEAASVTLVLDISSSLLPPRSLERRRFQDDLTAEISAAIRVPRSRLAIPDIRTGLVHAEVRILPHLLDVGGQAPFVSEVAAELLAQGADSRSPLRTGGVLGRLILRAYAGPPVAQRASSPTITTKATTTPTGTTTGALFSLLPAISPRIKRSGPHTPTGKVTKRAMLKKQLHGRGVRSLSASPMEALFGATESDKGSNADDGVDTQYEGEIGDETDVPENVVENKNNNDDSLYPSGGISQILPRVPMPWLRGIASSNSSGSSIHQHHHHPPLHPSVRNNNVTNNNNSNHNKRSARHLVQGSLVTPKSTTEPPSAANIYGGGGGGGGGRSNFASPRIDSLGQDHQQKPIDDGDGGKNNNLFGMGLGDIDSTSPFSDLVEGGAAQIIPQLSHRQKYNNGGGGGFAGSISSPIMGDAAAAAAAAWPPWLPLPVKSAALVGESVPSMMPSPAIPTMHRRPKAVPRNALEDKIGYTPPAIDNNKKEKREEGLLKRENIILPPTQQQQQQQRRQIGRRKRENVF